MSTTVLEQFVLSKPYFDREGLIVAEQGSKLVGFVHAGFGPNAELSAMSTDLGVTCALMVSPQSPGAEVRAELLVQSEAYLRRRGATCLYGGAISPLAPFYLGLYGGSDLPGLLASDASTVATFRDHDYEEIDRNLIFERELGGFRPPVDREQMQIRRQYKIAVYFNKPPTTWWEACTFGLNEDALFQLQSPYAASVCGTVVFWDLEPLASGWGIHAMGLTRLRIEPSLRGRGLATFLVSEAMQQLRASGVALVQAQAPRSNVPAVRLLQKLGFRHVDEGIVLRKQVAM